MSRSLVLLGLDRTAEHALGDALGGPAARFFTLAQRIAWGLTQPDLIRADVPETAARLVRLHGSAFPAHMLDAWVWRERDPARAEDALARARSLATPDHPFAYLLPSDEDWRCVAAPQQLVEVVPGRIWRVEHAFAMTGAPLLTNTVATIVRVDSGDVAIINPVALAPEVAQAIARLGPVRWVCSQGCAHSRYIAEVQRQLPGSVAIGTPGHLRHPPAAHVELDGVLGEYARWPAELELLPLEGHMLREVLLLDRPTRTLILQDVVVNGNGRKTGPLGARLYAFCFGVADRVGCLSYSAMMWDALPALQRSARRVLEADFTHVLGAHWPVPRADGAEVEGVRAALALPLAASGVDHKLHVARYFWSQPGFLRDFIRYKRTQSSPRGARLRAAPVPS